MHFAVVSPPFSSHLRALEALAGGLLDRGHRVSWLAPVDVLAMLTEPRLQRLTVGRTSHPAGSLDRTVARAARPGGPIGLRRVILDMAAATESLCVDSARLLRERGVEVVIADQMEAAGGLLAASLGLRWVSVACALPINREPRIPLPVMPWGLALDEAAEHRNRVSEHIHDAMMAPLARTLRRQSARLGLAPHASLADALSPLLQLSQTTPGFDLPRARLPAHFHAIGPLRLPTAAEPPFGFDVRPDRPFVFASLGTLQGGRFSLWRRIARACRAIDAQLLVAHCGRLDAAQCRALEADGATWVTDFAPQRAALARADAVVTHAGLNTVMDALVAGTPMLALPIAFDQPGVAARVLHAGAGLRQWPALATSRSIGRDLRRLLAEPSFAQRAAVLGAEVDTAGGTTAAVDLIERALGVAPRAAAPASVEALHAA